MGKASPLNENGEEGLEGECQIYNIQVLRYAYLRNCHYLIKSDQDCISLFVDIALTFRLLS